MKKYKLIKEYPGSPKLGLIVEKENDDDFYSGPVEWGTYKKNIENHPEFWEEVVEKDYEILSFKGRKGTTIENDIFTNNDEFHRYFNFFTWHLENIQIHSVKRMSDSEVFSIGDRVTCQDCIGEIKEFFMCGVINIEGIGTKDDPNMPWSFPLTELWDDMTELPQKVKKPLFTTEDGVDIYEGDEYYELITPDFHNKPCIWNIIPDKTKGNIIYDQIGNKKNGRLWFSTKESAEEYISMNKSKYSINDILASLPNKKCEKYISIKQMIENLKNM